MRKRRIRKGRVALLIIIAVVLVAAVYVLWTVYAGSGGERGDSPAPVSDATVANEEAADPDNDEPSGPDVPLFYDESRSDRYEAFSALNPGTAFDDIIWMVNVDLDMPPYEYAEGAADPTSVTVLVTKHFYLPSDFSPPDLVGIDNTMLRAEAADAMKELIMAAAGEGHRLWVQSGYRSYSIQAGLFAQYSAQDGEEAADRYSARPGHSEHQTGLVADLNTITDAFGETPEGRWAAENCWQYGYIVRYTAENSHITLFRQEPWHLRYIGREAAAVIRDLGFQSFEEYWVKYVG